MQETQFGKRARPSGEVRNSRQPQAGSSVPDSSEETKWAKWLQVVKGFVPHHSSPPTPLSAIESRLFLEVEIRSRVFQALVDTGATRSYVGPQLVAFLSEEGYQASTENLTAVQLADGTLVSTEGRFTFPARIGTLVIVSSWEYLPTLSTGAIVGLDLLKKLQCTIRPDTRTLICQGEEITLQDSDTSSGLGGLQALSKNQLDRLNGFLDQELPRFQTIKGPTSKIQHSIKLKPDTQAIKQRYYPRNPVMQQIINEEVCRMLKEGVIEPSTSAWSSPVVLVKKSSGKHRFCIDFRKVNEVTIPDAYPLPFIQGILDKLRGARFLTTLDLRQGYWQVPLSPESKPITAFTVPGLGLFQFKVMPFGLHAAPATFQRLLDSIIGPELEPNAFCYLDDIIIVSSTFDDHLEHLNMVFQRLVNAGLQLQPEKCVFCRTELKYLGHVVNRQGIQTDPEKIEALLQVEQPTSVKAVRRFLGMASWYRKFIPQFSRIAAPLTLLLQKHQKFLWGNEQTEAFNELKEALTSAPVLACPDFQVPFSLQTDASNTGLGAVLTQLQEGHERVIAYASRTLSAAEKNYSTVELECLCVVWAIRKLKGYLEGYHFTVISDQRSLRWLHSVPNPSGRLMRWTLELQQYDFTIEYRKGALNRVADALSRAKEDQELKKVIINSVSAIVPEEKCKWYQRMLQNVREEPENFDTYRIQEGKLFICAPDTNSALAEGFHPLWRLCVPTPQRNTVLQECHDQTGHLGIQKTIHRINQHYHWPGLYRDVVHYVRSCPTCQTYKKSQEQPAGKMCWSRVEGPWEIVSTDLIGPLTRSSKGNVYLVVFQDRFTKWTEVHPLRKATASTVIKAFQEKIVFRFGTPKTVVSDNGSQFVNKLFQAMTQEYGIKHQLTPPYTPQANPVERMNKVIGTMVAQLAEGNQKAWDVRLPEMMFAINTARHESTGFSPSLLNYGREMLPPGSLREQADPEEGPVPPAHAEYRQQLEKLEHIHRMVKENLAKAFRTQSHHYNLRRRSWRPQVGDMVYRKEHLLSDAAKGFCTKLAPKFAGPFQVKKMISPVMFQLQEARGHRAAGTVHVKDLKPAHQLPPLPVTTMVGIPLEGMSEHTNPADRGPASQSIPSISFDNMAPRKAIHRSRSRRTKSTIIRPWNPAQYLPAKPIVRTPDGMVARVYIEGVGPPTLAIPSPTDPNYSPGLPDYQLSVPSQQEGCLVKKLQRLFGDSPVTPPLTSQMEKLQFSPLPQTPDVMRPPLTPGTPPLLAMEQEELQPPLQIPEELLSAPIPTSNLPGSSNQVSPLGIQALNTAITLPLLPLPSPTPAHVTPVPVPASSVQPAPMKRPRRNRKRHKRVRVFLGPGCFVRMREDSLNRIQLSPLPSLSPMITSPSA